MKKEAERGEGVEKNLKVGRGAKNRREKLKEKLLKGGRGKRVEKWG